MLREQNQNGCLVTLINICYVNKYLWLFPLPVFSSEIHKEKLFCSGCEILS